MSASWPAAVTVSVCPYWIAWLAVGLSVGAWLTSLTVTVKDRAADSAGVPLSVTRTVIGYEPGPCASVGVQEKAPVVALMLAPAGAPASRLYVSVLAGRSASWPVAVKLRGT